MRHTLFACILVLLLLTGCSLPQVRAEDRLFLDLHLDYLGEYRLPKMSFAETTVGGLSGLSYDRQSNRFYAISDDRSNLAPARFYTLKMSLGTPADPKQESGIRSVELETVTTLKQEDGSPYAAGSIDPEGIAISPRQTVFVSSEGVSKQAIPPFVNEYDRQTGGWRSALPIPRRYLPADQTGVQDNKGFEALTLNPGGYAANSIEPFRLFTANEAPLVQDLPAGSPQEPNAPQPVRMMHFLVGSDRPTLLSEHLYLVDPVPAGAQENGLCELITLDQGGHFLSLERSFGMAGFGIKLYQLATGGATDISGIPELRGNVQGITPVQKELVLDLAQLGIPLDNLEGMTLGPKLPDGSQSLILVSDDNFSPLQVTQFLLFRLRQGQS